MQVLQAIGFYRVDIAARRTARRAASWSAHLGVEENDLYQEAVLRIGVSVSDCIYEFQRRSEGEQCAYLDVAARSACIDYIRRQRKHYEGRRWFDFWEGTRYVSWTPTPEDSAVATERLFVVYDMIVEALALMSPRERETFLWRIGLGPEPTGISKWTVRTYNDRALAKLAGVAKRKGLKWLEAKDVSRLSVR